MSARAFTTSLTVLCCASCADPERIHVPLPPLTEPGLVLITHQDPSGARPRLFRIEADAPPLELTSDDRLRLHAGRWACTEPERLGLERLGRELASLDAPPRPGPEEVLEYVEEGAAAPGWRSWSGDEIQLSAVFGFPIAAPSPCVEMDSAPLPLAPRDSTSEFALHLGGDEFLIGMSDGYLVRLFPDGRFHELQLPPGVPHQAAIWTGEELWLYGEGGALWHGSLEELETATTSFVREPSNPFYVPCQAQGHQLGGDPTRPDALLVASDTMGAVSLFSLATRGWTSVRPSGPGAGPDPESGALKCTSTQIRLAPLADGGFVAVSDGPPELVFVYADGRFERESVRMETGELRVPSAAIDPRGSAFGDALLVSGSGGELLERLSAGRYRARVRINSLLEREVTRILHLYSDELLFLGGSEGLRQLHVERGLCRTQVFPNAQALETVVFGATRAIAIPGRRPNRAQPLIGLEWVRRPPCYANPP